MSEFVEFPKIARWSHEIVITEKIDGTNAQVNVAEDGAVTAGSRTRFLSPDDDNFGFARWVADHAVELRALGVGRHYGEWWGQGIQRKYGLDHKRFSLFNTGKWATDGGAGVAVPPDCCFVVPILWRGMLGDGNEIERTLTSLAARGSVAAPGFASPEGIVIYHVAAGIYFKKTIEKDAEWKGKR